MNTNKIATGSINKKLLAALAVLAVAFVVLAAVPAVATDSDANGGEASTPSTLSQVYVSSSGSDTTGLGTSAAPYATIDKALKAVSEAGVITISSDIEIKTDVKIEKSVTLDLGSHTVTITHDKTSNVGRIFVGTDGSTGTSITVSIQNGSIKFVSQTGNSSPIRVNSATAVTFDRLSITSDDYGVSVWGTTDAKSTDITAAGFTPVVTLDVRNSTIATNGGAAAISTNGTRGGEQITVTGSNLTSAEGAAIYAPSNAKFSIQDSTLTGVSGIDVRAGIVDVKTSTINYNGPAEEKTNSDGPVAFGVGISVFPNKSYGSESTGAQVTVDKDTVFNAGANAYDEVIVGTFEYPDGTNSVTYSDIIHSTAAIPKKADVKVGDVEVKYEANKTGVATISDGAVYASSDAVVAISGAITITGDSTVYGSITFSGNGKITVASGAVLRLGGEATVTAATGTGAVTKPIVNNGTIVIVGLTDNSPIKNLIDGKTTSANVKVGYTIAYPTTSESSGPAISCNGVGISYSGEKVTFTAVMSDTGIDDGYKLGKFAATASSTGVTAPTITGADGTYTFTMVASNLTIKHTADDAWTASFYLVFNDGADTIQYTALKGNKSSVKLGVPADPVVTGYSFYGWYSDAAITTAALTGDDANVSLANGPVSYYADMQKLYTVVIKEFVDGKESTKGGVVSTVSGAEADSSSTFSVTEKSVKLYIMPSTDFKLGSVTVGGAAATVAGAKSPYSVDVALGAASTEVDVYFLTTYAITYDSSVSNGTFTGVASAAAGEKVVVTGTGSTSTAGTTYGVASVTLSYETGTGASKKTVTDTYPMPDSQKSTLWTANADGTYTFTMPACKVTVTGTFAPVYSITTTDGTSAGSYKLVASAETAAAKAQVTITVTNGKDYAASALKVTGGSSDLTVGNGITDNKDGTYTFTMPAAAVTITATEAKLYDVVFTVDGAAVENVKIGGIATDVVAGKVRAYKDQTVAFDAVAADGYTIKSITVTGATFNSSSANAAGTYTFSMGESNVTVEITGEAVVYYKLVVDNADVSAYSDADGKNAVDLDKVPSSSTVYLKVSGTTATKIITSVTVSYTLVTTTDASGTAAATTEESYKTIGATKYADGVYTFKMPPATDNVKDDTVNASIVTGTPTSTVTITAPTVGSIAVTDSNGKTVGSGDKVAYGTVLTVAVTLVDGKVVSTITPEMERTSIANNVFTYTYTMGIGDVTIAATIADGYVISVVYDGNAVKNLTVPDYAAVGASVELTFEVNTDKGYSLVGTSPVTAVYGSSASAAAVTGSVTGSEGSYTFTMPAGAVTVTIDTNPKTITVDTVDGATVKVAASAAATAAVITSSDSGKKVYVTVTPGDGYNVNGIIVTDAAGNTVKTEAETTPANTWSFTMPSSAATVKADVASTTTLKASESMIAGLRQSGSTISVMVVPTDGGYVPSGTVSLAIGYMTAGGYETLNLEGSWTATTDKTDAAVITVTVTGANLSALASATGVTVTAFFDGGLSSVPTSNTISASFEE